MTKPLPQTRLTMRQLGLPVTALIVAIVVATAAIGALGFRTDQAFYFSRGCIAKLLIGFAVFSTSMAWLVRSWRPGFGKPTDYALPWLVVALLVLSGLLQPRSEGGMSSAIGIAVLSLPFMVAFTLLTRLFAPTNVCSTSSAIGFAGGACAILFYALHCTMNDTPSILLAYAMGLGAAVLFSRTVLCRFIAW